MGEGKKKQKKSRQSKRGKKATANLKIGYLNIGGKWKRMGQEPRREVSM